MTIKQVLAFENNSIGKKTMGRDMTDARHGYYIVTKKG